MKNMGYIYASIVLLILLIIGFVHIVEEQHSKLKDKEQVYIVVEQWKIEPGEGSMLILNRAVSEEEHKQIMKYFNDERVTYHWYRTDGERVPESFKIFDITPFLDSLIFEKIYFLLESKNN